VVHAGDALAHRTDEEDRSHAPLAQAAHSQLVRGARTGLPRCSRGT
jgi:hypothetical protein